MIRHFAQPFNNATMSEAEPLVLSKAEGTNNRKIQQ